MTTSQEVSLYGMRVGTMAARNLAGSLKWQTDHGTDKKWRLLKDGIDTGIYVVIQRRGQRGYHLSAGDAWIEVRTLAEGKAMGEARV